MLDQKNQSPGFLFEIGWEVCNKVGGIHTVLSTKSPVAASVMGDNYIFIGPDFAKEYNNIEFIEDKSLYSSWCNEVYKEDLRVKVGRWAIEGSPIAILVNFTSLISHKDEILSRLWEDYKLDSITGGWDYVEPVLFGIGAAKVIKSLINHGIVRNDNVVAHFHEWMSAAGGLLLKQEMPSVATVFTTHATVMGRCIAGNGMPLYRVDESWNIEDLASRFGVMAKHSMEKVAAANYDAFTTVSEITARECELMLKQKVSHITPNGFDKNIVPVGEEYTKKREEARKSLVKVAEVSLGKKFSTDPFIVGISGRYEVRNKGIDEFIDGIAKIEKEQDIQREILVYIMVPSWQNGARWDLQEMLAKNVEPDINGPANNLTHVLGDFDNDAVVNHLRSANLLGKGGNVSVMFMPAYLNGDDGIFNKSYYDLLIGFDLTVLPSYYEPWGYTPLESIAFGVPTVSTDVAGFGKWINSLNISHEGITIVHRTDDNQNEVSSQIKDAIRKYVSMSKRQQEEVAEDSKKIADMALWNNFYQYYQETYDAAIASMHMRVPESQRENGGNATEQVTFLSQQGNLENSAKWYSIMVEAKVPDGLKQLDELSRNLWWSWNRDARMLFESIDKDLWAQVEGNPIDLIDRTSSARLNELAHDKSFISRLNAVYNEFKEYMSKPVPADKPRIAYFSMEYGIHSSLKIYSGGLGILAGDYLKEASDKNVPMVAVGLLYRYGYFTQKVSVYGDQEANYEPQNFYKLPIHPVRDENGKWQTIQVMMPGRSVTARIWCCEVGRTKLYLLDADHEGNHTSDRSITYHLYGGDWYNRMKQEMLLGIGGIRALKKLGITADVYHCNEGHAAFIGLERIYNYEHDYNLSFSEAMEVVRHSSLFTTHTPVPAGHDAFADDIIRQYMSNYPERLAITWEQFLNLGKVHPTDSNEKFSMSVLACNLSQEINGVSMLHGDVSKDILAHIWPGYLPCELDNINYVTNGVHFPTWASSVLKSLYYKYFGESFEKGDYSKENWNKVYNIPDKEFWDARLLLKSRLIQLIKTRLLDPAQFKFDSPSQLVRVRESIKPDVLTIGFARRFATYKRAHLLFTNLDRLSAIVNNTEKPVQFVFAGKAHPADKAGQDLIKRIIEVSKMPQFIGKIVFLQNYDIELAHRMVQGVDIWMNTPTRPLEASGTSGEKAVMNGVMQLSVLDGWWVEGYKKGAGWALPQKRTFQEQHSQDELDAEIIYNLIEDEIVPLYYDNRVDGVPGAWVQSMKKCVAEIASEFTTNRMLQDYEDRYYNILSQRHKEIIANNFKKARSLAAWKRYMAKNWSNVKIIAAQIVDNNRNEISVGQKSIVKIEVELNGLNPDEIGVEAILARPVTEGQPISVIGTYQFKFISQQGSKAIFQLDYDHTESGSFDCSFRIYAKNDKLVHRTDLALVKWL